MAPNSNLRFMIHANGINLASARGRILVMKMSSQTEAAEPKSSVSLGMFGMILVLVAIGAFFVALAVAYAFAIQDRPAQRNVHLSNWFWISTALIVASSITLQWARRDLR